jgi:CheY-like chemotaxis protein
VFEDVAAPSVQPSTAPSGKSLAILVAEDNKINALLACSLLSKLGHRPVVASDGAAAVAAWRGAQESDTPFDVVLMDVQMPGLDGLEATRLIRTAEQDARRTPIIALTANAYAEDRDACLAAGMDDFLVKPLDRERLATMLIELSERAVMAA